MLVTPARFRRYVFLPLMILLFQIGCSDWVFAQGKILVYGETPDQSHGFLELLQKQGLKGLPLSDTALIHLQPVKGDLLLVLAGSNCPPESRVAISRLLLSGSQVIVIGSKGFSYNPSPVRPISAVRFDQEKDYQIIKPKRKRPNGSVQKAGMQIINGPGREKAIQFSTSERGMTDIMVQFPVQKIAAAKRSVLQFWAKGNAYMDLLALEVMDNNHKKWLGFVPLSSQWQSFNMSFADFIPEGWTDPLRPYPLLDPSTIISIAMGTNMMTVWREKPMDFCISNVALAENENRSYTPTSALLKLRLPFLENGIVIPEWLFDPFYGAALLEITNNLIRKENYPFDKQSVILKKSLKAWTCPVPYLEQPGTKTGTDASKAYKTNQQRAMRHIPLWEVSNNIRREKVAELRIMESGSRKGAGIALFGFAPQDILEQPVLEKSLIQVIRYLQQRPKILGVKINTTVKQPVESVVEIVLQNPTAKKIAIKLTATVNSGLLKGSNQLIVDPYQTISTTVRLSSIPEHFEFKKFAWQVRLTSEAGDDIFADSVDVERALIKSMRYMVNIQQHYPDGRYTNHYFADAYGVRAMIAYVNYLDTAHHNTSVNEDLWKGFDRQDILKSANRFCDMLIKRQHKDGSVPMGYAEHSGGYNVADGGQISLGLGQVATMIKDPQRKKTYLEFCNRFLAWAETFYITDSLSAILKQTDPGPAAKGYADAGLYGLGISGKKRVTTGPSWVLSDILATQILMSHFYPDYGYKKIASRNALFYLQKNYPGSGYYQAEALFWIWLNAVDPVLRQRVATKLTADFLPSLFQGNVDEVYEHGGRNTLKALPLLYYQRYIADTKAVRAALLKYVWSFASEHSNSIDVLSATYPKPVHGESLAAAKYLQLSSLWAIEMLQPGSTLIDFSSGK